MCLSCSKTDQFRAGEREGCCDEDVAEPLEAVVECAWILPIPSSNVTTVLSSSTVDHCAKNTAPPISTRYHGGWREGTHINPMTAATLMIEKQYSNSPYTLTLHKLIATIINKNTVMLAHFGISRCQYSNVMDAAIISKGNVKSHCIA